MAIKPRFRLLFFLLSGMIFFAGFINYKGDFDKPSQRAINADGKGYYAYLPAIFIYQDLNYRFTRRMDKKYYGKPDNSHFKQEINGSIVNKYPAGVSVMILPFFLLTHGMAYVSGYPPDGYAKIYEYGVALAAIFYVMLGGWFLVNILRRYGIKELYIYLTVLFFFFGTNLFLYTIFDVAFSHAYNFTLVILFIYFIQKYSDHYQLKYILFASFIFGMIIICRPINTLVILTVPFLVRNVNQLKTLSKIYFLSIKYLIPSVLLFSIPIGIQMALWYLQTGSIIVYSYENEGFNLTDPAIGNVLFSFRKGLFIYTPLTLISLGGFVTLLKKRQYYQTITLIVFFAVFTYITSSWWQWYYGMGLGQRPFIDIYAFFAILLGIFINELKMSPFKIFILLVCFFFIYLQQIQIYQYKNFILHWSDMTFEGYWKVFLKTGDEYKGVLW